MAESNISREQKKQQERIELAQLIEEEEKKVKDTALTTIHEDPFKLLLSGLQKLDTSNLQHLTEPKGKAISASIRASGAFTYFIGVGAVLLASVSCRVVMTCES